MRLVYRGRGVLVRRRLVEVQSEVELACTTRACAHTCREGGGTVRRGGEGSCSGGSTTEVMDNQESMVDAWGRRNDNPQGPITTMPSIKGGEFTPKST